MKSMIKIMMLVVLLALLLPGIHGDAYSIYVADSVDLSAHIFELPAHPDIFSINDPYTYVNNYVSEHKNTQDSVRTQNIPNITVNGMTYEFETDVQTQGYVNVHAYTTTEELTQEKIAGYISAAQSYPGVEILGDPTEDYNCHSYAWYMESTANPYWIVDVGLYAYDVHTVWRENTETPQPGDICVYLKNGIMVHSAVVVSSDGATTICRSKWGPSVLCEHPIGSVPTEYLDVDGMLRYCVMTITPHEWSFESAGVNQHTRTCTICSYEETLSCEYEYTYFYDDMHNASCKYCSNGYSGAFCTFDYRSNGDGTHTGICTYCKHESSTTTLDCTLDYIFYGVYNDSNAHVYACTTCGHVDSGPTPCLCIGTGPCAYCGHVNDHISLGIEEEELVE